MYANVGALGAICAPTGARTEAYVHAATRADARTVASCASLCERARDQQRTYARVCGRLRIKRRTCACTCLWRRYVRGYAFVAASVRANTKRTRAQWRTYARTAACVGQRMRVRRRTCAGAQVYSRLAVTSNAWVSTVALAHVLTGACARIRWHAYLREPMHVRRRT